MSRFQSLRADVCVSNVRSDWRYRCSICYRRVAHDPFLSEFSTSFWDSLWKSRSSRALQYLRYNCITVQGDTFSHENDWQLKTTRSLLPLSGCPRATNSNDGYVTEMPSCSQRVGYYEGKRNARRRINGLTMRDAHAGTIYQNDTLLFVEYQRAVEWLARATDQGPDNANEATGSALLCRSNSTCARIAASRPPGG